MNPKYWEIGVQSLEKDLDKVDDADEEEEDEMIQLSEDPDKQNFARINLSFNGAESILNSDRPTRNSHSSARTTTTKDSGFGGLEQATVISGATITAHAYSIF